MAVMSMHNCFLMFELTHSLKLEVIFPKIFAEYDIEINSEIKTSYKRS